MSYLVSVYIVPEYGTKTLSTLVLSCHLSVSFWYTTFSRTLPKNGSFDMKMIKMSGCKTSFAQTVFPVKGVKILNALFVHLRSSEL